MAAAYLKSSPVVVMIRCGLGSERVEVFPFRKNNTEEEQNQLKPQEFHRLELNLVSNSQSVDEEDECNTQDWVHGVVIDMQIFNIIERQGQGSLTQS